MSSTYRQQGLTTSSLWGVDLPHKSRALISDQRVMQDAAGMQDALHMLLGSPGFEAMCHFTLRACVHPACSHMAHFLVRAHAISCLQMRYKVMARQGLCRASNIWRTLPQ